jgi:hypothetical protein
MALKKGLRLLRGHTPQSGLKYCDAGYEEVLIYEEEDDV